MGAQDDFERAQRFLNQTGVSTPTMVWDPSFETWSTFGVQANSQMLLMAGDFSDVSNLVYGFDETKQAQFLSLADDWASQAG